MARRRDKETEGAPGARSEEGEGQEADEAADAEMADPGATAAEQQESLQRIERGGITVAAERRLSELREQGGLFTSDLSVNGWALAHQLGLRPLSQVMGSSIYQMGYQGAAWGQGEWGGMGVGQTYMVELGMLSRALNEVRTRALGRLAEEAMHVGADAVVEVNTRAGESSLETGSVSLEHTVFGTAVRREAGSSSADTPRGDSGARASRQHGSGRHESGRHEGGRPVLTELSVADFSKLVRGGFEPLGIVAWSSVFFASYNYGPGMVGGGMMSVGATQNFELREFTQAFYNARESVMAELNAQASALCASGVVGVRIGHRAVPHTLGGGMGTRERSGLMVTFNAIGTAIGQTGAATLHPPETTIDLTT
ncbi:MAG TPA: heavy metal-binding domain-containing protein [Solirubrobacteraceae bacterium]|jgi:uncharacterized protein YbjQ (UPF0145 family)|nr:heavy metal-binding domain-containing protein [Solirubrobacteraceae bacterium]